MLLDLGGYEDTGAQAALGEYLAQHAFGQAISAKVGSGVDDAAAPRD